MKRYEKCEDILKEYDNSFGYENSLYESFVETSCFAAPNSPMEYALRGLAGEVGEVQEEAKKYLRDTGDTGPIDTTHERYEKFVDELGDVLWYVTRLANLHGMSLDELQLSNMKKLVQRLKEKDV